MRSRFGSAGLVDRRGGQPDESSPHGQRNRLGGVLAFKRGFGITVDDATGNGHTGYLTNNPTWVGSTAPLGDGTSAIHTTLGAVQWTQQFAINTIPTQNGFGAIAPVWVRRLDDFGAPTTATSVNISVQDSLQGTIAGSIPLAGTTTSGFSVSLSPYLAAAQQITAGGFQQTLALNLQPAVQLDSVDDTFKLAVTESYTTNNGPLITEETITLSPVQLLQFNGSLWFGPLATEFTSIANIPTPGVLAGGGISTVLAVNPNAGFVKASPSHTYGDGSAINVVLLSNGNALASNTVTLNSPANDTGTVQNISFLRNNQSLTPTGALAYASVLMPLGFSIGISPTNHESISFAPLGYILLDANLNPVNSSFVMPGPLFGIEETLPYLFGAANLTWQVNNGQIILNPDATSVFVRQDEDDLLQNATDLADPTGTNRVSNDGYFRNATPAGGPLIVTADGNGVAQVSVQLTLQPPELRPHFPYASRTPGLEISTGNGLLDITNSAIAADSYLNVTGPLPISYGRDCTLPGCTAALAGPASLAFAVNGDQLSFTPDGGLLAYGSVESTNLMWGYATGTEFAQQAGQVSAGAYCMAGTFLHADQSGLDDSQRATVILFSGFGNATDPSYLERPGQSAYDSGLANYAGLNFRSPLKGEASWAKPTPGHTPRSRLEILCPTCRRKRHSASGRQRISLEFEPLRLQFQLH